MPYICEMIATDTRQHILEKNFESIRRHGFQGTRTDKVIEDLGITKGAFYHYFRNKQELGYAVIDEILAPQYLDLWKKLDRHEDYPIDGIIQLLESLKQEFDEEKIKLGCTLNNLIQEMAPVDEGFQERLSAIVGEMHGALTRALERAGNNLQLSVLIHEPEVAFFILAAVEGSFTIGKAHQKKESFDRSINQLIRYVRSLKR